MLNRIFRCIAFTTYILMNCFITPDSIMCTIEKEAQRGVKEQHEPGLTFLNTLSDILTDRVM